MKGKPNYISKYHKSDKSSSWTGIEGYLINNKKNQKKRFSVTDFFEDSGRKLEEAVEGPGAGAGAGCGVGVGFGLVGGFGLGGSPWNQVKMVFGLGAGCGVGIGFGYGQGIGFGSSVESLRSRLFPPKPNARKRGVGFGSILDSLSRLFPPNTKPKSKKRVLIQN